MNLNPEQLRAVWEAAKALARQAITDAFERLPGADGAAREAYAVEFVLARVESVDHLLPAIGQFMDLPLVDLGERFLVTQLVRQAVKALVRREYAALQIEQIKETV